VTEATVRIARAAERARPMLLAFGSLGAAVGCAQAINASPIMPVALEFMDRSAVHLCEGYVKAGYPLDADALLIVAVEGTDEEVRWQLEMLDHLARKFAPRVADMAASDAEAAAVWRGWEGAYGAMAREGGLSCVEGTVPLSALETVLPKIGEIVSDHGLRAASLYRAGDGTLRTFVLLDVGDPNQERLAGYCEAAILKLCLEAGGSISGENGIGLEKRDVVGFQFSALDLAQQMRVKSVFDPKWLLNPGKLFPLRRRSPGIDAPSERAA
jgi:glycolate oxidase